MGSNNRNECDDTSDQYSGACQWNCDGSNNDNNGNNNGNNDCYCQYTLNPGSNGWNPLDAFMCDSQSNQLVCNALTKSKNCQWQC